MRIAKFCLFFLCWTFLFQNSISCWEDHADKEDHKETDRLFKLAQEQTGADEYEKKTLEKEAQESIEKFLKKTSKKRKTNEKNSTPANG